MEDSSKKIEDCDIKNYKKIINNILKTHRIPKQCKDDLSSDLIYILHKADKDFNGTGTIEGYRHLMANFYIKTFLRKYKKKKMRALPCNCAEKERNEFDYLTQEEKEVLYNKIVYKYTFKEIGPEAKKIFDKACKKVKFYENNN